MKKEEVTKVLEQFNLGIFVLHPTSKRTPNGQTNDENKGEV